MGRHVCACTQYRHVAALTHVQSRAALGEARLALSGRAQPGRRALAAIAGLQEGAGSHSRTAGGR